MLINKIIMFLIAFGVLLGGVDRMLNNRFGYGERFEAAFKMLGPIGLSMAGIICLAPILSAVIGRTIGGLCSLLHIDPSIFGSVLAIDMGGYTLAMDLAIDPKLGLFSGILVAAVFGCTVVFTLPVGLGMIDPQDHPLFTRGILLGFPAMPVGILAGGWVMGLDSFTILWNSMPVLLITLLLAVGVVRKPEAMNKGFQVFARFIKIIATLGLTLAAAQHIVKLEMIPQMTPLQEAMKTVSSICITMLGAMPLAELIQRLMKKPFAWLQRKTGLNGVCTTGLLLGMVTVTPVLAMIGDMDKRGKVVCSACLVCNVGTFGAHMAFAMNTEPEMIPALLATKLAGTLLGGTIALIATRDMYSPSDTSV